MPPPDPRDPAAGRRARNLAIALSAGLFALMFYAVTIAKLGSAAFQAAP